MDGGAWWATVHGVTKSWTWLSDFTVSISSSHSLIHRSYSWCQPIPLLMTLSLWKQLWWGGPLFLIFYILDVSSLFSFLRGQVWEWSMCSFWFDTVPSTTTVHKSTDIEHFCEHGGIYSRLCKEASPGSSVGKNLSCSLGDTGSISGLGRSHMPRDTEAHVPQLWSHTLQLLKATQEKPPQVRSLSTVTREQPPLTATWGKFHAAAKTQRGQK